MAHVTRYYMYRDLAAFLGEPLCGDILGVSGIEGLYHMLSPHAHLLETAYPAVDMRDLPFEDGSFDYVISDQVLEHIEDPYGGVRESYRVLKDGGIAVHTSCFINNYHPMPKD